MKALRKTIRKIILENTGQYDKLITMLCSENLESVNQAIEIAKALEFVSNVSYDLKSYLGGFQQHVWEFAPTEELMNKIESYWSTKARIRTSYSDKMHSIFPMGSTGKLKILLGDNSH